MRRRIPWLVLGTAFPSTVLIVTGFLGSTPYGVTSFFAGVALLTAAVEAQRRQRAT